MGELGTGETKGDVNQYLADQDQARSVVEELGTKIDDDFAALRLLIGLPTSWNVFKVTVETGAADRDEQLNYNKVYRLISQEDNRRKAERSRLSNQIGKRNNPITIDQDVALVAKQDTKCEHCGRKGHAKDNCWELIGYPERQNRVQRSRERKEESPEANSATVPVDFVGSFMVANNARRTYNHPRTRAVGKNPPPPSPRPSIYMSDLDVVLAVKEVDEEDTNKSFSVTCEDNYSPFFLDSGCSLHMCGNESWFSKIEEVNGPLVETASHQKHRVTKQGTICFESVPEDGTRRSFALTNVQYIPGFSNLLSLGALRNSKVQIDFTDTGFNLVQGGKPFARGVNHPKNLFKLEAEVVMGQDDRMKPPPTKAMVSKLSPKEKTSLIITWHRRLCHASVKYMQACLSDNVMEGVTVEDIEKVLKENPCVTCSKGKGHRNSFPNSDSRETTPLSLIHSDVAGPIPITTQGGCRYWLTFIDDATRYLWTYPLHSKKEVVPIATDWIQMVENQLRLRVKRLRTDNGTEYSKLDPHLTKAGIRRETTVPPTPQQNGRAERINRTLAEKMACMIIDAGISPSYWAEALLQATYVINRTPSKPMGMISPYEALYGIKPSLADLHIWGSPCQALILPRTGKFRENTEDCIFLGYSELKKAYRLYNLKTRKIMHSREATFFEGPDKQKDMLARPEEINDENSPPSSPEDDPIEKGGDDRDDGLIEGESDHESTYSNAVSEIVDGGVGRDC